MPYELSEELQQNKLSLIIKTLAAKGVDIKDEMNPWLLAKYSLEEIHEDDYQNVSEFDHNDLLAQHHTNLECLLEILNDNIFPDIEDIHQNHDESKVDSAESDDKSHTNTPETNSLASDELNIYFWLARSPHKIAEEIFNILLNQGFWPNSEDLGVKTKKAHTGSPAWYWLIFYKKVSILERLFEKNIYPTQKDLSNIITKGKFARTNFWSVLLNSKIDPDKLTSLLNILLTKELYPTKDVLSAQYSIWNEQRNLELANLWYPLTVNKTLFFYFNILLDKNIFPTNDETTDDLSIPQAGGERAGETAWLYLLSNDDLVAIAKRLFEHKIFPKEDTLSAVIQQGPNERTNCWYWMSNGKKRRPLMSLLLKNVITPSKDDLLTFRKTGEHGGKTAWFHLLANNDAAGIAEELFKLGIFPDKETLSAVIQQGPGRGTNCWYWLIRTSVRRKLMRQLLENNIIPTHDDLSVKKFNDKCDREWYEFIIDKPIIHQEGAEFFCFLLDKGVIPDGGMLCNQMNGRLSFWQVLFLSMQKSLTDQKENESKYEHLSTQNNSFQHVKEQELKEQRDEINSLLKLYDEIFYQLINFAPPDMDEITDLETFLKKSHAHPLSPSTLVYPSSYLPLLMYKFFVLKARAELFLKYLPITGYVYRSTAALYTLDFLNKDNVELHYPPTNAAFAALYHPEMQQGLLEFRKIQDRFLSSLYLLSLLKSNRSIQWYEKKIELDGSIKLHKRIIELRFFPMLAGRNIIACLLPKSYRYFLEKTTQIFGESTIIMDSYKHFDIWKNLLIALLLKLNYIYPKTVNALLTIVCYGEDYQYIIKALWWYFDRLSELKKEKQTKGDPKSDDPICSDILGSKISDLDSLLQSMRVGLRLFPAYLLPAPPEAHSKDSSVTVKVNSPILVEVIEFEEDSDEVSEGECDDRPHEWEFNY